MSDIKYDLLVKVVLKNNLVPEEQLNAAMRELAELRKTTRPQLSLGELLLEKGLVDVNRAHAILASQQHGHHLSGQIDPVGMHIDHEYEENDAVEAPPPPEKPANDDPGSTQRRERDARFEDYRIIQRLGVDAAGTTYQAVYGPDCSRVILRILSLDSILEDPQATERFLASVKKAHKLDHPGIQKILRLGRHSKRLFYAAEYLTGRSLRRVLLDKGTMDIADVMKIAVQSCRALAYAHGKKIYHTQLDPSKFIIDSAGHVRLVGFGIGGNVADNLRWLAEALGDMPYYVAPEMAAGDAKGDLVGAATDIYSLGAVLFHCLTGRPPFQGNSLDEVLLDMYQNENLMPILQAVPGITPQLCSLIMSMLTPEPRKRPASAAELLKQFQEIEKHYNPVPFKLEDFDATARYRVVVAPTSPTRPVPALSPRRATAINRERRAARNDGARTLLLILGGAAFLAVLILGIVYGGKAKEETLQGFQNQQQEKLDQDRQKAINERMKELVRQEKEAKKALKEVKKAKEEAEGAKP